MTVFRRASVVPPELRRHYLTSLPQAQEWFLEEQVLNGEVWEIPGQAYAVFNKDSLVEFHVSNRPDAVHLLEMLQIARPFGSALCKSFDRGLLDASGSLGKHRTQVAYLFRSRERPRHSRAPSIALSPATASDAGAAERVGGDFFASKEEIENLILGMNLWIARKDAQIVGCGVTIPIGGISDAVDVGMVIAKAHQRQGLGTAVVTALADRIEQDGRTPICGCAKQNTASKATLERAGFVAEHRLYRIDFGSTPDQP